MVALEQESPLRFKSILIFEAMFAGAYISLTNGLFVIYLVSIGYAIEGISFVVFASAAASMLIGVFLHKRSSFIVSRVKLKLTGFHALTRIMWLLIPLTTSSLLISVLYSMFTIFNGVNSTFFTFAVYSSFTEDDIRDVTAKRSAANGISSILGFALGVFLLAFLPAEDKFAYIFPLGALLGLMSTLLILLLNLSHLEGASIPKVTEQPEKIFSASLFLVILLTSGNLLGIVWAPYVMTHLKGPDFLAASMSLVGTFTSIIASLFWRKKAFKALSVGLGLNAFGPLLIWATPWPAFHLPINAFTTFMFTGANFLGTFLFANYTKWFGAVRSSLLLVILGTAAQMVAGSLGIFAKENHLLAFSLVFAIQAAATILAVITISEVAVVPEDVARTYSWGLYSNSIMGYQVAVEISRDTILTTLKLAAFSLVIIALYLIYRILWILIG